MRPSASNVHSCGRANYTRRCDLTLNKSLNEVRGQETESGKANGHRLARQLGSFDATMIVMGGIVGAGIFMNSYVVARIVHTPMLILSVWVVGGLTALLGGFIYAELASHVSGTGGQYAYLCEAYHPMIGFLYGWALLLVIQSGGMAAVAVIFARYFLELTHLSAADWVVAVIALAALTIVNCFGVRAGASTQNLLMVLKITALIALFVFGLTLIGVPLLSSSEKATTVSSTGLLFSMSAALTPVMFAYAGWQTATFMSAELRHPKRDLARGLILGVCGVVTLYLAVNVIYIGVLGADGVAGTTTPASAVMRLAVGSWGARMIAAGISISTLGFLSQGMLTAPRVYFAMARDGLFFRRVAWVSPRKRVPAVAIVLQGSLAVLIALSGRYEQILNYVVSVDFIGYGLTATTLFVFRHRSMHRGMKGLHAETVGYKSKSHPVTTLVFIAICGLVVISTIYAHPKDSMIGLIILLAGIPTYFVFRRIQKSHPNQGLVQEVGIVRNE